MERLGLLLPTYRWLFQANRKPVRVTHVPRKVDQATPVTVPDNVRKQAEGLLRKHQPKLAARLDALVAKYRAFKAAKDDAAKRAVIKEIKAIEAEILTLYRNGQ